jgi:hypothetical protein
MKDIARIGRIGVLAVGLGIGAAVAALPGTASADPFSPFDPNDFATSVDGLGIGAAMAAAPETASAIPASFDPNDFAISVGGITLFQVGTATATSGMGDIAIADGANSRAVADDGFGDFARADGTGSIAVAGSDAANATGNNFDSASAAGDGSVADAGFTGSFDSASADGTGSVAFPGVDGSVDSASAAGNGALAEAGAGTLLAPANFDFASDLANLTTIPNIAEALAEQGSGDLAFVLDPFGLIGSQAEAGFGGSFDLAGALGDNLTVDSILTDFILHIAPLF